MLGLEGFSTSHSEGLEGLGAQGLRALGCMFGSQLVKKAWQPVSEKLGEVF